MSYGIFDRSAKDPAKSYPRFALAFFAMVLLAIVFSPISKAQVKQEECSISDGKTIQLQQYFNQKPFAGLASYLNGLSHIHITTNGYEETHDGRIIELKDGDRYIVLGRFKALVFSEPELKLCSQENTIVVTSSDESKHTITLVHRGDYDTSDLNLSFLKYHHIWQPLAYLCSIAETALLVIKKTFPTDWGRNIIIFALVVQIFTLPLAIWAVRLRKFVADKKEIIDPQLHKIKQEFDGEAAHEKIMSVYKKSGVSPFFTMKTLIPTLLQVPILIAVFNALGEMHQLSGQSFWLVKDLSLQDQILKLPFELAYLGNTLNLLPIIMVLVPITPLIFYHLINRKTKQSVRDGKQTVIVSIVLLLLFYPFPASMIVYWTASGFFSLLVNKLIRNLHEKRAA